MTIGHIRCMGNNPQPIWRLQSHIAPTASKAGLFHSRSRLCPLYPFLMNFLARRELSAAFLCISNCLVAGNMTAVFRFFA